MLPALSTAASGMTAQSQRVEAVALTVASLGATAPAGTVQVAPVAPVAPVRIGALPVGDPLESVVTLVEAKLAYQMNAAVLETGTDMVVTLLDTLDGE
jgi:flagellar basal-body rod protein FlgC